jgi:methylglutaconyl-CoA hydratase
VTAPSDGPLVRYDVDRGVARLTLDSPHNRNALSRRLVAELLDGLQRAIGDDSVRAVVLTHTGPVFCSGADLKETAQATAGSDVPAAALPDLLAALIAADKPTVARIAGPARAGGIGLVAACDVAIAAEPATFAFTEVRIGVIPAVISAVVLPRLSPRAATELYLTGEVIDAHRAAAVGLVTTAVGADDLDAETARYVGMLVRGAPGALAGAKQLLRRYAPTPPAGSWPAELAELTTLSVRYFTSAEGREGVAAFREKRSPSWVPEK